MNKFKLKDITLIILLYLLSLIIMIYYLPIHNNIEYLDIYILLMCTYIIISCALLITHMTIGIYIFEPIVIITFLYLMIFCIAPMMNIVNKETLCFGINIMGGAKKATYIFILSYCAFYIGYYYKFNRNLINPKLLKKEKNKYIYQIGVTIWIICYILTVLYLMSTGKGILYIITGGVLGNGAITNNIEISADFMSMFSYSLIPTWMYIYIYGNNKILKILLGILTCTSYIVRGYRFILVIFIMAPIIFNYTRKNKRPKIVTLVSLLIIMILMVGILGFSRNSIKSGTDVEWSGFSLEFVTEAVKGNFDIYKPYYGLVESIPNEQSYTYGGQLSYTFTMFIPRAIWKSKPSPMIHELIAISVNDYASKAGAAWPNLGEFYSEFGILGSIIFMFIFGRICGISKCLYKSPKRDTHSLIAYSIILPSYMQIVIRGYTPSNFYLMIFLLTPILLLKCLYNRRVG